MTKYSLNSNDDLFNVLSYSPFSWKNKIYWAVLVRTLIQVVEIWIWITIAFYFWKWILKLLDYWVFDEFSSVLVNFKYLFWYDIAFVFVYTLGAILIVMFGRWIMSWASNNWWQTPNNNWN